MLAGACLVWLVLGSTEAVPFYSGGPSIPVVRPPTRLKPVDAVSDLANAIGYTLLRDLSREDCNTAVSPFGALTALLLLWEGSGGQSFTQLHHALGLDSRRWERNAVRLGYRDLHRHLRGYLSKDNFLSGVKLSNPMTRIRPEYLEILNFYGYNHDILGVMNETNTEQPIETTPEERTTDGILTTGGVTETTTKVIENTVTNQISTEKEDNIITTTTLKNPETSIKDESSETETSSQISLEFSTFETTTTNLQITTINEETSVDENAVNEENSGEESTTQESTTIENSEGNTEISSTLDSINIESTTQNIFENSISTTTDETSINEDSFITEEFSPHETSTIDNQNIEGNTPVNSITEFASTIDESSINEEFTTESISANEFEPSTTNLIEPSTEEREGQSTPNYEVTGEENSEFTTSNSETTTLENFQTTTGDESEVVDSKQTENHTPDPDSIFFRPARSIDQMPEGKMISFFRNPLSLKDHRPYLSLKDYTNFDHRGLNLVNGLLWWDSGVRSRNEDTPRTLLRPFYISGGTPRLVSMMIYGGNLLYAPYLPSLNGASALALPLDDERYILLILMPKIGMDVDDLIDILPRLSLKKILASLVLTRVRSMVPSFSSHGIVDLTPSLNKHGVCDVFDEKRANLSRMSLESNLHVHHIEQAVTVVIRHYVDIIDVDTRFHAARGPPELFIADRPFVYFVVDRLSGVSLLIGKLENPLDRNL